ncbi:MAG: hypothetical protein JO019_04210 [Candidatus Kaiserbacteria bacterium]|nr:hypothetical protein [Candidatus Kaiserbacteria bacterium]
MDTLIALALVTAMLTSTVAKNFSLWRSVAKVEMLLTSGSTLLVCCDVTDITPIVARKLIAEIGMALGFGVLLGVAAYIVAAFLQDHRERRPR